MGAEWCGVDFDGITRDGVLLEAKGPGYEKFVLPTGEFDPEVSVGKNIADQARRQLVTADRMPLQWHVAEPKAADAIRDLFEKNGLDIPVFFSPPYPMKEID